jgi:hypothetical protein
MFILYCQMPNCDSWASSPRTFRTHMYKRHGILLSIYDIRKIWFEISQKEKGYKLNE